MCLYEEHLWVCISKAIIINSSILRHDWCIQILLKRHQWSQLGLRMNSNTQECKLLFCSSVWSLQQIYFKKLKVHRAELLTVLHQCSLNLPHRAITAPWQPLPNKKKKNSTYQYPPKGPDTFQTVFHHTTKQRFHWLKTHWINAASRD